jgi:sec-independent protein translocase protein TatA
MQILAWGMPGLPEWIIIAALGLLFFGKRLPDVGRSLGRGIVEFKKGLKGIQDDIDEVDNPSARPQIGQQQPKFDPYTGKPLEAKAGESER